MKFFLSLSLITLAFTSGLAQNKPAPTRPDTAQQHFKAVEMAADFPGGMPMFYRYATSSTLVIPEAVHLLGFSGKAIVSFVVDTNGRLTDITPKTHSGLGLEEAIAQSLIRSPRWKPGSQNGTPVRVQMTMPFSINLPVDSVSMESLRNAEDGYVFKIKENICTINQAEQLLGPKFARAIIDSVSPFNGSLPVSSAINKPLVRQINIKP